MSRILIALYMNFLPSLGLHDPGYKNGMGGQSNSSEESSRQAANYAALPGFAQAYDRSVPVGKSKWELPRGH